jgi:hypothetical protein
MRNQYALMMLTGLLVSVFATSCGGNSSSSSGEKEPVEVPETPTASGPQHILTIKIEPSSQFMGNGTGGWETEPRANSTSNDGAGTYRLEFNEGQMITIWVRPNPGSAARVTLDAFLASDTATAAKIQTAMNKDWLVDILFYQASPM